MISPQSIAIVTVDVTGRDADILLATVRWGLALAVLAAGITLLR